MTDLDELPFHDPDWPPAPAVEVEPQKCRHPRDRRYPTDTGWECRGCGHTVDRAVMRRGKQSRNYGNRAELEAARRYGGVKVGAAGGPVDIRGVDWNTQMKTHRRKPPAEWTKAFSGMAANRERMPRLLLRFVLGPGTPPDDYFVVRGSDWLAWHGRDSDEVE